MNTRKTEIGVGLFVALGFAALFMLAMQVSNLAVMRQGDSYLISAAFENIGGLKVRSPVTVSGVRVGRVDAIDYDTHAYQAVVSLRIDSTYDTFPEDTTASIFTAGPLAWIIAAIAALPFFFTTVFSPMLLVGGWYRIYTSNVWTLTYREIQALESLAAPGAPAQGDAGPAADAVV